MSGLVVPSDR